MATRYPNFQYEERPPGLAALARQSPSMRTPDAGRGVVNPPLAAPTPGSDTGPLTAGQVVRNALIGRAGIAAPTPAAATADPTPDFSGALDANPALMASNTAAPTQLPTPTPATIPPVASPLSARAMASPPSTVQPPTTPVQPLSAAAQPEGLPPGVTRAGSSFSGANVGAAQPAPDPNALGGRADTFNQLASLQAQNASVPQGGATLIDGAGQGADARTKFFDEANLRNVERRGPMPGKNGAAVYESQLATARMPLVQRAQAEQNTVRETGDTQRAQLQEQGLASRARVVDARQQQANALAERRVDIEAVRAGQGNIPTGYQRTADGGLTFIKGGPADPSTPKGKNNLTDTQSKALLFGTRMQSSNKILDELEKTGKIFSTPGANAGFGIGAAVNLVNSEDGQKLDQAKRDFINATLRRESGAVISDNEFANGSQQYFPQPGDAPGVIAQKKANRELATRGILAEVPDAENRVSQVAGPGNAAPAALPGGMSRQIGTSGGKPVYEDAQGNRFVGG